MQVNSGFQDNDCRLLSDRTTQHLLEDGKDAFSTESSDRRLWHANDSTAGRNKHCHVRESSSSHPSYFDSPPHSSPSSSLCSSLPPSHLLLLILLPIIFFSSSSSYYPSCSLSSFFPSPSSSSPYSPFDIGQTTTGKLEPPDYVTVNPSIDQVS